MEAGIGGGSRQLYARLKADLQRFDSGRLEWDPDDWLWDGDLFVATPVKRNELELDYKGKRQICPLGGAGEDEFGLNKWGRDEFGKRRKLFVVEEEDGDERDGSLALKLGAAHPLVVEDDCTDGNASSSRSRRQVGNGSRGICQVEGCRADLSNSKDYHRRHKVCESHAKASKAIVGNAVQRFCQQCSRFHLLQEFDEGRRSCRRRLAGHNKRRRKTHPENVSNECSLTNDQNSSYLLTSLLRILSNLQSNAYEQSKDHDLLCHLLRNIANVAGSFASSNSLPQALQNQLDIRNHIGSFSGPAEPLVSNCLMANELLEAHVPRVPESNSTEPFWNRGETTTGRSGMKNFDLNDVYKDEHDDMEEHEQIPISKNMATAFPSYPCWLLQENHQSSPPQTNKHSNSQSSNSHGDGGEQSRTDRIVFKLFGKDPNDIPFGLRQQMFRWLSSTPRDVESYIRPGCIILTLYLCLSESNWKELSCDLRSSLKKLLDLAMSEFWKTGWIYVRMQHQMAFIYDGQLLLDGPLIQSCHNHCKIWSVSPLAVSISVKVNFTVKGFNLVRPMTRLLCSFEGKYIVDEATQCLIPETTTNNQNDTHQYISFSCSVPSTSGRGFIEVEDLGLSGVFFPFIVAETDICTEICTLESVIDIACSTIKVGEDSTEMKKRACAINFLHEIGWLLRKLQLMSKVGSRDSHIDLFPLTRLKWLLEFAIKHDWRAIVIKLLDALVGGYVDTAECPAEEVLFEIAPLHYAVQNNSRSTVETLLRYIPDASLLIYNQSSRTLSREFLFGPDTVVAYGVTPLHVAASMGDAFGVLDALTNDPRQVGPTVWRSVRDASGFTPEDYARNRGFDSYLRLVENKIRDSSNAAHVVLEVSSVSSSLCSVPEESDRIDTSKRMGFEIRRRASTQVQQSHCTLCSKQELSYLNCRSSLYRPAMLMMVGIAAICVCVGLLLKGPPEVLCVISPFRWELLGYGTM